MQTNLAFHIWWRACSSNAWCQCTAIAENDWKRNQTRKAGSQRWSLPGNHFPGRCCSRYLFLALFLTFFGYFWKILKMWDFLPFWQLFWHLKRKLDRKDRFSKKKLARKLFLWKMLFQVFVFGFFFDIFWLLCQNFLTKCGICCHFG